MLPSISSPTYCAVYIVNRNAIIQNEAKDFLDKKKSRILSRYLTIAPGVLHAHQCVYLGRLFAPERTMLAVFYLNHMIMWLMQNCCFTSLPFYPSQKSCGNNNCHQIFYAAKCKVDAYVTIPKP